MLGSTIDITPSKKTYLAGYNTRNTQYEKILHQLEANIIILKNIIFISIDTLYITEKLKNGILEQTNLKPESLFLMATHTHFAPAIDDSKTALGLDSNDYLNELITKISHIINTTFQNRQIKQPKLFYAQGHAYHSINRRLKVNNTIEMKPNISGVKDEEVQSILVTENEVIYGVFVNYCCHATSYGNHLNDINADYIHDIRQGIRQKYNKNIPILFMQGFSGNIRPYSVSDTTLKFQNMDTENLNTWTKSLASIVSNSLDNIEEVDFKKITISLKGLHYRNIIQSNNYEGELQCHIIKLGKIIFIGLNAEPVVEYALYLKEMFPSYYIIPIGCVNGAFGYLPTDSMIEEGGYESNNFFKIFGINAQFKKNIEQSIKDFLVLNMELN